MTSQVDPRSSSGQLVDAVNAAGRASTSTGDPVASPELVTVNDARDSVPRTARPTSSTSVEASRLGSDPDRSAMPTPAVTPSTTSTTSASRDHRTVWPAHAPEPGGG
jgi:hypothetical protein